MPAQHAERVQPCSALFQYLFRGFAKPPCFPLFGGLVCLQAKICEFQTSTSTKNIWKTWQNKQKHQKQTSTINSIFLELDGHPQIKVAVLSWMIPILYEWETVVLKKIHPLNKTNCWKLSRPKNQWTLHGSFFHLHSRGVFWAALKTTGFEGSGFLRPLLELLVSHANLSKKGLILKGDFFPSIEVKMNWIYTPPRMLARHHRHDSTFFGDREFPIHTNLLLRRLHPGCGGKTQRITHILSEIITTIGSM